MAIRSCATAIVLQNGHIYVNRRVTMDTGIYSICPAEQHLFEPMQKA